MNYAGRTIMRIILPKCGNKINVIENYDIERSRREEEIYIKILNTSQYQREKEVEKLRQENKEIIGDQEALGKLLKCHPFPRYQGPFHNTLTDKMYEFMTPEEDQYTFQSYTTFIHEDSQPCHVWEIKDKSKDKLKLHLVCNTYPVVIDHTLSGPASKNNMAIMYTCQKRKCVIVCPCMVCSNVTPACKRICGSDPCNNCSAQCTDHPIDLPRKFNINVHSFTIPCYSKTFGPTRIQPSSAITSCSDGHRYAGIPRSCDKCRLDLLDHQIHHHVLHGSCKFCKIELRKLDKETNVKLYRNVEEMQQTDNRTCGFCYKVFTRIKTRKLHEKLVHGSYDETTTPKSRQYIERYGVVHDRDKKPIQCESCDKSFASNIALDYHKMQTHKLKVTKYTCEICVLEFKSETSLTRHIVGNHECQDWNKCEFCTSKFKRKDKLTRHMRDVHNETNVNHHYSLNSDLPIHLVHPYDCKVCGKRFKRKENEKRHEKLMACQKNEILKCQQCDKTFSTKKTLKRHTTLVHMAPASNKCGECDLSFVRKADLLRHEENVHNNNLGQIKCENCSKSFRRRDNMLRHLTCCKPLL